MTLFVSMSTGLYANRPSGRKGQRYRATDVPLGMYYHDGTLWRPDINGNLGTEPPTSGWTTDNFRGGSDSVSVLGAARRILSSSNGVLHNWRTEYRTLSLLNKTIIACINVLALGIDHTTGSCYLGFGARESSTGKMTASGYILEAFYSSLAVQNWTTASSFSSTVFGRKVTKLPQSVWFKLVYSATDWTSHVSFDGIKYIQLTTQSIATHMSGSGPDQLFWGVSPFNTSGVAPVTASLYSLEWS